MKCISCGRRGHLERQNCLYCGGALIKQERDGVIRCPSCQSNMVEIERNGVLLDVCSKCSGVWLDAGELDEIIRESPVPDFQTVGLDINIAGTVRFEPVHYGYRHCPICQKLMGQKNYRRVSGVIMDICQIHGIFLDPVELEKVLVFFATGGLERERRLQTLEQRESDKAEMRAGKRQRIQQSRSSSMIRRINPEFEFTIDVLDSMWDFLKWIVKP